MKKVLIMFAGILLLTLTGCATATATTTTTSFDTPHISDKDAIAIAQQHCVKSSINMVESRIAMSIQQGNTSKGWSAEYVSNGKWDVTYIASSGINSGIHQWSVFESSMTAVFLGN